MKPMLLIQRFYSQYWSFTRQPANPQLCSALDSVIRLATSTLSQSIFESLLTPSPSLPAMASLGRAIGPIRNALQCQYLEQLRARIQASDVELCNFIEALAPILAMEAKATKANGVAHRLPLNAAA